MLTCFRINHDNGILRNEETNDWFAFHSLRLLFETLNRRERNLSYTIENYQYIVQPQIEMPPSVSNDEYADMHFIYGFCNRNARAAVRKYPQGFPDITYNIFILLFFLIHGVSNYWLVY